MKVAIVLVQKDAALVYTHTQFISWFQTRVSNAILYVDIKYGDLD